MITASDIDIATSDMCDICHGVAVGSISGVNVCLRCGDSMLIGFQKYVPKTVIKVIAFVLDPEKNCPMCGSSIDPAGHTCRF
jgi:hypothetical protein